jgi:hypothetical protein
MTKIKDQINTAMTRSQAQQHELSPVQRQNGEIEVPVTSYLSPDGDTPKRILSYHSLLGEGIDYDDVTPAREISSGAFDADLSPFTPTSSQGEEQAATTTSSITPPRSIQEPPKSLSPPLFTTYRSSDSVSEGGGSLGQPKVPKPHVMQLLQPRTHLQQSLGGLMVPSSNKYNHSSDSALMPSSGQLSVASAGGTAGGRSRRPPRVPQQFSSLQSSPLVGSHTHNNAHNNNNSSSSSNNNNNNNNTNNANLTSSRNQPVMELGRQTDSQSGGGPPSGHNRIPTDSTNFTFLSALTDDGTGEFLGPRRRTLSWDNGNDYHQQHRTIATTGGGDRSKVSGTGSTAHRGGGRGGSTRGSTPAAAGPTAVEKSPLSLPVSLLQPILNSNNEEASVPLAPPVSILASNLRKAPPSSAFASSSSSVTEGMLRKSAAITPPSFSFLHQPHLIPSSSSSVTEGMSNVDRSFLFPSSASLVPRREFQQPPQALDSLEVTNFSNLVSYAASPLRAQKKHAQEEEAEKSTLSSVHHDPLQPRNGTSSKMDEKVATSAVSNEETTWKEMNGKEQYRLSDALQAIHEPTDETSVFKSVEQDLLMETSTKIWIHRILLPRIIDDRVHDFKISQLPYPIDDGTGVGCRQSDGDKGQIRSRGERTSPLENISDLIKKLMTAASNSKGKLGYKKSTCDKSQKKIEQTMDSTAHQPSGIRQIIIDTVWLVLLSSLLLNVISFYFLGTFPVGDSTSWRTLLIGCQLAITIGIAKLSEPVIEFFIFRTRMIPKIIGTTFSLVLAQSKGWPYMVFSFGLFHFVFLFGGGRFPPFFRLEDLTELPNAANLSGYIISEPFHVRIMCLCLALGMAATLKRTIVGNYVGKQVVGESKMIQSDPKMRLHCFVLANRYLCLFQ